MASHSKHLEHLAEIPLFSALSKRDLGRIAKASNEITVEPGHVLVDQGDAGREAFVVIEGTATVGPPRPSPPWPAPWVTPRPSPPRPQPSPTRPPRAPDPSRA